MKAIVIIEFNKPWTLVDLEKPTGEIAELGAIKKAAGGARHARPVRSSS